MLASITHVEMKFENVVVTSVLPDFLATPPRTRVSNSISKWGQVRRGKARQSGAGWGEAWQSGAGRGEAGLMRRGWEGWGEAGWSKVNELQLLLGTISPSALASFCVHTRGYPAELGWLGQRVPLPSLGWPHRPKLGPLWACGPCVWYFCVLEIPALHGARKDRNSVFAILFTSFL